MKFLFAALFFCALAPASAQPIDGSTGKQIVFNGVNVVPMDKEVILRNHVVVVRDGRIEKMGKSGTVKYGDNAVVIDATGKYLMPGLAEMHAHVPPNDDAAAHEDVLQLFALHGITTIRGMLGHPSHLELRKKLATGTILGPRLYTSGPSFNGQSVQTPEQAEQKVAEQKQAGYDFLKIHPGLTKENFAAVANAAKKHNIPFAGHISFAVGVWNSIDAKYQTIDHLDGFVEGLVPGIENLSESETGFFGMYVADRADLAKIKQLTQQLKQNNVWVVPTQALAERWISAERTAESFAADPEMKYMDATTLKNWVNAKNNLTSNERFDSASVARYLKLRRKIIAECEKSGVGLLLGCDAPQVFNVPGVATHHELKYLVDAGLSPYEALKTGTINVAAFYGMQGKSGVVKTGAVSDLVLLGGDPLKDISNTQKIEGVMIGNKWLPGSYINQALKGLEKPR